MQYYSVEQVAELLGLHAKTVRGYVREGRLRATRIGKQYRITAEDLAAFTGSPTPPSPAAAPHAETSAVVQIDDIDPAHAVRVINTLMAVSSTRPHGHGHLRVETVHNQERASLKVIVLGDLDSTAEVLRIINSLIEGRQ